MKSFSTLTLIICINSIIYSQSDSIPDSINLNSLEGNFLFLKSNQLIQSKQLEKKNEKNFYSSSPIYFLTDSLNIPVHRVKFYKKGNSFYANVSMFQYCENNDCFANRTVSGRVNLYYYPKPQKQAQNYSPNTVGEALIIGAVSTYKPPTFNDYYNKGTNELKKINYKNLSYDLKDNGTSMDLLKSSRNINNIGGSMLAVGILSTSFGFISYLSKRKPNSIENIDAIFMGSGILSFVIGTILMDNSKKLIKKAVIAYNK